MRAFAVDTPAGPFRVEMAPAPLEPAELPELLRLFYPHVRPAAGSEDGGWLGRFAAARAGGRFELALDGEVVGRHETALAVLQDLEYRLESRLIRSCGRRVAFHAGAADVGGRACLLAGDPEAGKTSCTFQLVELGHAFLAEEVAVVDPATAEVHPFPQALAFGPELVEDFRRSAELRHGELHALLPAYRRYVPRRLGTAPVPVDTLVLPRYRPDAAPGLEELSPADALTETLGYCFEPGFDREEFFDRVIALLERWRIVRLTYGDASGCRRLLGGLFPAPAIAAESRQTR